MNRIPTPLRDDSDLAFASVGRAAALAFAGVLGFASGVARLAAALAFATILAFTAMLGRTAVVSELAGVERRVIGAGLGRL